MTSHKWPAFLEPNYLRHERGRSSTVISIRIGGILLMTIKLQSFLAFHSAGHGLDYTFAVYLFALWKSVLTFHKVFDQSSKELTKLHCEQCTLFWLFIYLNENENICHQWHHKHTKCVCIIYRIRSSQHIFRHNEMTVSKWGGVNLVTMSVFNKKITFIG